MYFKNYKNIIFTIYLLFNINVIAGEVEVIKFLKSEYLIDYKSSKFDRKISQTWIYQIKDKEKYNSYFEINEFSKRKTILKMFSQGSISSILKKRGLKSWTFYVPNTHMNIDATYILIEPHVGSSYIYINRLTNLNEKRPPLVVSDLSRLYLKK